MNDTIKFDPFVSTAEIPKNTPILLLVGNKIFDAIFDGVYFLAVSTYRHANKYDVSIAYSLISGWCVKPEIYLPAKTPLKLKFFASSQVYDTADYVPDTNRLVVIKYSDLDYTLGYFKSNKWYRFDKNLLLKNTPLSWTEKF